MQILTFSLNLPHNQESFGETKNKQNVKKKHKQGKTKNRRRGQKKKKKEKKKKKKKNLYYKMLDFVYI